MSNARRAVDAHIGPLSCAIGNEELVLAAHPIDPSGPSRRAVAINASS